MQARLTKNEGVVVLTIFESLAVSLVAFIAVYLGVAFIEYDCNPRHWSEGLRYACVYLTFVSGLGYAATKCLG